MNNDYTQFYGSSLHKYQKDMIRDIMDKSYFNAEKVKKLFEVKPLEKPKAPKWEITGAL